MNLGSALSAQTEYAPAAYVGSEQYSILAKLKAKQAELKNKLEVVEIAIKRLETNKELSDALNDVANGLRI